MNDSNRRTSDPRSPTESRPEEARIVIIGAGDLGQRIARALVLTGTCGELTLCVRPVAAVAPATALLSASGRTSVGIHEITTLSPGSIETMVRMTQPDLIVFAASLLSPWFLNGRHDPAAEALRRAGFAGRISAQLPLLIDAMEGIRAAGFDGPVVNCAYPDATNAMLGGIGLAPTTGIGNVGMIRQCARAALRDGGHTSVDSDPIRVIAHHAQVPAVMAATPPENLSQCPAVYLGSKGRDDLLPYRHAPLEADRTLNDLSAVTALQVIRALLSETGPTALSVPGPLALPGGYPVTIGNGGIAPDLPPGVTLDDARGFNERAARADGIELIERDGTLIYTGEAARTLNELAQGLGDPLPPRSSAQRFTLLRDAVVR